MKSFDDGSGSWLEHTRGAFLFSLQCEEGILTVGSMLDLQVVWPSEGLLVELESKRVPTWNNVCVWAEEFSKSIIRGITGQ